MILPFGTHLELLYNTKWNISLKELTQNSPIEADITSELYDIELEYQMKNSEKVAIDLRGIRKWYSKLIETFCYFRFGLFVGY